MTHQAVAGRNYAFGEFIAVYDMDGAHHLAIVIGRPSAGRIVAYKYVRLDLL